MPAAIITRIERQKRTRHRVSVFVNGEFSFGLSEESALRFRLAPGVEITAALRDEMNRADALHDAKAAAERAVARRMHSELELRRMLARKGFPAEIIDSTIGTFSAIGLIDDRRFAELFVRDRLTLRPKGRVALRRELSAKGVPEEISESVLAILVDEHREEEDVRALAAKYLNRNMRLPEPVRRRRLLGFLQRRGFSYPVIAAVLNNLVPDDSDPE